MLYCSKGWEAWGLADVVGNEGASFLEKTAWPEEDGKRQSLRWDHHLRESLAGHHHFLELGVYKNTKTKKPPKNPRIVLRGHLNLPSSAVLPPLPMGRVSVVSLWPPWPRAFVWQSVRQHCEWLTHTGVESCHGLRRRWGCDGTKQW